MFRKLCCLVCAAPLLAIAQRANALGDMSEAFENLTRKVSPAVVKVMVTGYGAVGDEEHGRAAVIRRQHAIGSGVIVDPNGYIITNAHVVAGAQDVTVALQAAGGDNPASATARGRTLKATITGVDRSRDIAVLKVNATGLPVVPFGDYDRVRQGELVLAFGSPEGLEDSVTMGVVSSVARQTDPDQPMIYIQTDAAVNPGNSGGPLVNVQGQLIGINTFILSESGGSQGTNFAIPSVIVRFVYQEILIHGHVHGRVLGLHPQPVTAALAGGLGLPEQRGLIVGDVAPDGPAAKAGVKIRDILLQLDGTPIDSLPEYEMALYRAPHGSPVTLELLRGGQTLDLQVPVLEQPEHESDDLAALVDPKNSLVQGLGILGVEISDKLSDLIGDLRISSGVLVAAMASEAGVESGLQSGDVIHSINGVTIQTLAALRAELARFKAGNPIALQVEREGRLMYLAFNLE
jgi:serine protease Do